MKKNNILSLLLTLALTLPVPALADETDFPSNPSDAIHLSKTVTQSQDVEHEYTITLESFVTGKTVITQDVKPCDIILVLDLSSSMTSDDVDVVIPSSKTRVPTGTKLERNTNYIVVKDGKEYYLNMFRINNGGIIFTNYRYYVRYKEGYAPTSINDGYPYNGYSDKDEAYTVSGDDEIYIYTSERTESVTRLEALKIASKQFVESIYANNPEGTEKHKVAIVGFNEVGKTLQPFTDITEATVSSLNTKIDNIRTSDTNGDDYFTNPASGLYEASNLLDGVKNDGRNKVVVFFTDGNPCPSGTDRFNNSYGRAAVNMSYVLKQPTTSSFNYTYTDPENSRTTKSFSSGYGAKVYSVAILDSENNYIRRFLHFVSSNYPSQQLANSYTFPNNTTGDGGEAPHDYYQLSNGSDLTSIFTRIAEASSGAEYNLSEQSVVVLDVMSSFFRLPEGTKPEDLEIFKQAYTGGDYDDSDSWGEKTRLKVKPSNPSTGETWDVEVTIGGEDGKDVALTGFDFAENFVGQHQVGNTSATEPGGYKLIINIKIEVDPENVGGATLYTNDARSGIYVKDPENPTAPPTPIKAFERPTVSLPNIIIRAYGLDPGESASYTIYKIKTELKEIIPETGEYSYKAYEDDKLDENFTPIHIIITQEPGKTNPNKQTVASAKVKLNDEGRYMVVEDSWAYTYSLEVGGAGYYNNDYDSHQWTVNGDEIEYSVTTKPDGGQVAGNNIIRTVCLGTQAKANDNPDWAKNPFHGDGTLFDFIHTKTTNVPATHIGEAAKRNWYEGPTIEGGTDDNNGEEETPEETGEE